MGKPQANDDATKEVLEEMRKDAEEEDDADEADDQDEAETEESDEDAEEESEDGGADEDDDSEDGDEDAETDEEESDESDEDSDDDSETEDEDGDDDEDADEDDDDDPENKGKHVTLKKHQRVKTKLKDRIKELEQQIADRPESVDKELKELADETGMKPEALAKLAKIVQKRAIPAGTLKEIEAFKAAQIERHQGVAFKKELKALIAKHPAAKDAKGKLRALAFTEKNKNRTLADIYFMDVQPTQRSGKRTAEPSRGGAGRNTGELDFEEIRRDPKLMAKLSDDDFDKYVEWEQKHKKSSIIRGNKRDQESED